MPAELFVDTSGWYPAVVAGTPDHPRVAQALSDRVRQGVRIVTTNLVVAETHALLLRRVGRAPALEFVRRVGESPNLVVASGPDIEGLAVRDWLTRFDDQDLSLTDAVSFTVMRQRGMREVLGLDRHFGVAGFVLVPSQP